MIQKTSTIIFASIAFFSVAFVFFVIYMVDTSTQKVNFLASVFVDEEQQQMMSFVDCLDSKGVYLYGTEDSLLIKKQKLIFKEVSIDNIFFNCKEGDTGDILFECLVEDVIFFPTWILGDGTRHEEVLSMEDLSEITGCSLENNNRYKYYDGIL